MSAEDLARHELAAFLRERGIRDGRVLQAIETVPREWFVPATSVSHAFEDRALPIGAGQTISQPYIVARMTELARLEPSAAVLEIGTGSGYQTAVLALLSGVVVTMERLAILQDQARSVLRRLFLENITFSEGDGTLGFPSRAPYDAILVTAAAPSVPRPLYDQLAVGGRLVIPVGTEQDQILQVVEKSPAGPVVVPDCGCRFVPLIGAHGWPDDSG